jgi:hypothetical protein
MFSWPPATTMSLSPLAIDCAASITAFRPDPHTALIVSAGTELGIPDLISAWRAGFWPLPAVRTWPRMTSETISGFTPACSSSARMTVAPKSGAATLASEPPNLPMAVLKAPAITMSVMVSLLLRCSCRPKQMAVWHPPAS